MEIVAEDNGVLSKIIKVKIQPEDYKSLVDSELKQYQKKSRIDGFRPGHVPFGLIKQKYGRALIYDQIQKIVPEKLQKFIDESPFKIIGEPIANKSEGDVMESLTAGTEIELQFVVGIQPEIDLEQSFDEVITRYLIDPSEDMIEEEVKYLTRRLGTHSKPELSEVGDFIYGQFIELDETGKEKETGVTSDSALAIDLIPNPENREQFIGLKNDDEVTFDIFKTIGNESEIARILNIKKEPVSSLSPQFKLKVTTINRLVRAEINQEFYDKIFGPDIVKTEEEFRNEIKAGLIRQYIQYTDEKLNRDLQKYLMKKLNPALPMDFIKRMLVYEYPDEYTAESFEKDADKIERSYQWTMIEKAIKKKYDIHLYQDEFEEIIKQYLGNNAEEQGYTVNDEELTMHTKNFIANKKNKEELYKIQENIMEHKVYEAIRGFIKIEEKSVPVEEFTDIFKQL